MAKFNTAAEALMVSTSANYHWVKAISASTYGNGALKLTMHGDSEASGEQMNMAEITVFTDDVALTERLIKAINGAAKAETSAEPQLEIIEPSTREAGAILICDEDHNDIAEFYHNEHATVGQSYETALMLARKLVAA